LAVPGTLPREARARTHSYFRVSFIFLPRSKLLLMALDGLGAVGRNQRTKTSACIVNRLWPYKPDNPGGWQSCRAWETATDRLAEGGWIQENPLINRAFTL
jgi:hypothetical protein